MIKRILIILSFLLFCNLGGALTPEAQSDVELIVSNAVYDSGGMSFYNAVIGSDDV
jgi:hypothetical protein